MDAGHPPHLWRWRLRAGHSVRTSAFVLSPRPQASILHERTYFSQSRNERLLTRGTPIVFYESGKTNGRSAAVAVARITSTVVAPKSQVAATLLNSGVVAEDELKSLSSGDLIAATTVDNVLRFCKQVSLKDLRNFGCVDGSNLITSKSITSVQLEKILTKGQETAKDGAQTVAKHKAMFFRMKAETEA
jgi:hypothetical protein